MPKGGHRAPLFPVSGLPWGLASPYRRRGLYHWSRSEIFTPRWGITRDKINPSPLPDGSARRWDKESRNAWRRSASTISYLPHYQLSEMRYLLPPCAAAEPRVKDYLINILEPHNRLGRHEVQMSHQTQRQQQQQLLGKENEIQGIWPGHIAEIMEEEDNTTLKQLLTPSLSRTRIPRLFSLLYEMDIWRSSEDSSKSRQNPFPFVDDNISLLRDLSIAETSYCRSNHRVNCRRHPSWIDRQYRQRKHHRAYLHRRRIMKEEANVKMWEAANVKGGGA